MADDKITAYTDGRNMGETTGSTNVKTAYISEWTHVLSFKVKATVSKEMLLVRSCPRCTGNNPLRIVKVKRSREVTL